MPRRSVKKFEEGIEGISAPGRKRSFWSSRKIITTFVLIFGIIVGIILSHYFVEPIIGQQYFNKYLNCESTRKLLDEQVDECLLNLNNAQSNWEACNEDLLQCRESPSEET